MNIIDYVKKYGNETFEEKEFNEVDNLVFSLLSYVYYDDIVPDNSEKMTLLDARNAFFEKHSKEEIKRNLLAIRNGIDLLDKVSKTRRYKDLYVYYSDCKTDEYQQFSAITFEISKNLVYVSFEGTNQLISGWEEDCMMAYKFPVRAQISSIKYLNKHFTFSNKKIIVGGHSKGGNLALVSAMYCNFIVRSKIIKIYSNDGPGLRKKEIESKKYKKIEDRFVHIVPNYAIVGMLLRHRYNYKIVKSNRMGLYAHDGNTWQIDDDKFKEVKLSPFSKVLDNGVIRWLDKYDDEKREKFVTEVFNIFRKNNVESLIEIIESNKIIIALLKETKNMDPIVKEMVKDFIIVIAECNKEHLTFFINKKLKLDTNNK